MKERQREQPDAQGNAVLDFVTYQFVPQLSEILHSVLQPLKSQMMCSQTFKIESHIPQRHGFPTGLLLSH